MTDWYAVAVGALVTVLLVGLMWADHWWWFK